MPPDGMTAAGRELERAVAGNAAGRPVVASRHFRRALAAVVDTGRSATDPETAYLRGRALVGLVMSEFELRGDVRGGLATLEEAERWAEVSGSEQLRLAVRGQQGLLWLRAGNSDRAVRFLDDVVARLDEAVPLDGCVALLNRGSVHLDRGDVRRARADLLACAERAELIGAEDLAFKARHNLGYAEFLAGDLPRSLATMARAAERPGNVSPAISLLDRSQVLLEAGLVSEADQTLSRAGELFARQRLPLDLAQVELARAECALLLRRPEAALRWAASARRRLARRRNAPWLARAELMVLRARLDLVLAGRAQAARCARIASSASDLAERAEGDRATRPVARAARAVRAAALVTAGRHAEARSALTDVGRLTGREPLTLALAVRAIAAQLAFDTGRAGTGHRQVAAGQQQLAAHRRQLGSVEAVTAAAVLGERLAMIEVAAALRDGDPLGVVNAAERGRATFAGPARVRPPDDPDLADLLAELRQAVERERLVPPDAGDEHESAVREAARLREAARERSWQLGGEVDAPEAPHAAELVDDLAGTDRTVVDFVVHAGTVHAVVIDGHGARLVALAAASEVAPLARRVATDLHALSAAVPEPLRAVVRGSLARGLGRLDELLLAPLQVHGPVHLVGGGTLVTLPWGLMPSRRGLATSVGTRLTERTPATRRPGVLAVAGPGLEHAAREVAGVAGVWAGARVLAGDAASTRATADGLRTAGVVHLAVHGHHETDNPLFSWVRLADGPLFAHELEGADLRGSLIVLSACEVGEATVRPGGEVLGLASVLLRLGAEAVVAALAPLRDDVAAEVAPRLHGAIRDGQTPAQALAGLLSEGQDPVPLSCFGTRAGLEPGEMAPGGEHRRR